MINANPCSFLKKDLRIVDFGIAIPLLCSVHKLVRKSLQGWSHWQMGLVFVWFKVEYSSLDFKIKTICWHRCFSHQSVAIGGKSQHVVLSWEINCCVPKLCLCCPCQGGISLWCAARSVSTREQSSKGHVADPFHLKFSLVQILMVQAAWAIFVFPC